MARPGRIRDRVNVRLRIATSGHDRLGWLSLPEVPSDDFRPTADPSERNPEAVQLAGGTRFIPRQYEPNYPYPLVVLLHARGGDEDQLVRAMPALSWRNYVGLGLRVRARHQSVTV